VEPFNEFRAIYEAIDLHRRTSWMVAQRIWSSVVMQGYNSAEAGILTATPQEIIAGAKACAQDIFNRIPEEPLTINAQILSEFKRKADRDDPYRFVLGAHRWLNEGRIEPIDRFELTTRFRQARKTYAKAIKERKRSKRAEQGSAL